MKKLVLICAVVFLLVPGSVGASVFSTHLGWYSGDPWYDDCGPFYRSCYTRWYGGWCYPYRCRRPWPGRVRVEKRESVLSELRRKDEEDRQAQIEKTKRYNEIYKKTHGEYPARLVIFSPNHPQAR